uniref:Pimeloyl-CoA synthetase n=1 Tax=Rhodococcus sp. TFB TaxID=326401 RepID=B8X9X8_9NOCA|nr:pimeloyl-CoA synthetase [Rhodococcus sp. TFB]
MNAIQSLLYPRSIAVVGASNDPGKLSGRPIAHLQRLGFKGQIVPVNPRRAMVQGLPAVATIEEITNDDVDLALIMVEAGRVAEAVRACGKRGIPAAIACASGFAETAGGVRLQDELRAAVEESGVRLLGPNCLGMIGLHDRAVPTFTTALDNITDLAVGPIAFVSQSGAFGSLIFSQAQQMGLGMSHFITTGNEVDLSVPELLNALVDDPHAQVLLTYLEGVADGRELIEAARKADAADKPLIAVKVGRSTSGAAAARSHTGAIAGSDAVFDGFADEFGVIRPDSMGEMLDLAVMFGTGRRAQGRRLTTITLSGGAGVLATDVAEELGLDPSPWPDVWQREMRAAIPPYGSSKNPIDLTATMLSDPDLLAGALGVVERNPDTDLVLIILGNADDSAPALVEAIRRFHEKTHVPLAVSWTGGNGWALDELNGAGIPTYIDPSRAVAALAALADYSLRSVPETAVPLADLDEAAARALISEIRSAGRHQLSEYESVQLLASYGIACTQSIPADSVEAAVAAFDAVGGPVAVKLLSASVAHKSDLGVVELGLDTPSAVARAGREILDTARSAGIDDGRLLVQAMATPGVELIVGAKNDPAFGPVVVVGLGGIHVEVLHDSQVRPAPIGTASVHTMLRQLRGHKLLDGVRGAEAVDTTAVCDLVTRLSWLMADLHDLVEEIDVNPVLASAHGAVAVDALVLLRSAGKDGV